MAIFERLTYILAKYAGSRTRPMTAEHQIEASDDWLEQSSEQSSEQWRSSL